MKTHMLSLRNNAVLIVLCIVFLFSQKANSQGKCSTASPLTIGANDSQCNSQNISGPTKLSNNSPPINTISGPSCGLASGTYSNWFSFTGDGTTIRVKTYAGNKIVGAVIFENQSCAGTMTAKSCATYADDGMPHVIDVPTTNGASYLVAIVGSSSTLAGKVCAYKTNGNPYSALCDPIIYTPPVSLPVKAKDNDCFSSYTNVVVSKTNPAPTTPCVGSTYANWWWGTFTATSTKTDLYLWGKDETNASLEVFEGPCGSSMNQVFCNNNTGAKDQPNWAGITTVPGKQYYVIIKATSSSTVLGRLCVYNETVEAQKPACTADMSFEGGNSNGWQANWGSYHLVTEPGSTFTWDVTNTTKPANLYQVTSGTGRDAITSMIPVVAPGGGNNSFRIGSLGTAEGNMAVINGKSKSHSAATTAKYCFTVSASNAGFGYKYAVVMDCPFHPKELQPLFDVIMTLPGTGDTIKCGKFEHYPNDGTSPFNYVGSSTDVSGKSGIAFTPWTDVITDLSGYVGQTVCVTFRVRDCEGGNNMGGPLPAPYDSTSAGSHWAYAYFDTYCVPMKIDVPEFCAGAGSIQICAPAGYKSYSWPAGQPGLAGSPTTQCVTVTNPTQGNTYTVNMISISNCPTTAKVKLKIIPVAKTADTVLCGPGHAITLAVSVVDPTADPPYTYSWSNGLGTSSSVTTSPTVTTTYTVTITNKSGCSSTETITATVNVCGPSVLATGAKVCPGSCASITAAGSGGTAPYTYTWSDGKTGAGPQSFCPAATTIYTVTVKDANGATGTDTVIVAINPVMTLSTTSVNVMCQGANNGSAAVTVTGGTAVFTYTWASAGGTGATTTNTLSPGTYTVTVTDSKGCTKTATASITEPPALTAVPSAAPANCGSNTGTASVMAGGGTPTYIYSWMPGGGVSATITALAAGSYTVTITDSKGCSTSATALVNSTGGVTAAIISSVNATCITPGSAAVTATGGTAPYVISWSPVGGTGNTASNLSAGTYTVIVTDANNCISNTTVTITEPAGPQLATTKVDDNCGKGVGSATVISTAGLSPYTYLWTPGGITMPNANALFANTYTVSVTDANGCTATSTVVVANLNGPTANATSTDITCFGANNGTAQVSTTGGALPYTYSWQPPTSTVASITGLSPGTYTINVIDKAGCTSVSSVTITEPPKITISAVVKDANCNTTNGSIVVTASGGTGALTATWQPIGGPGFTANNLGAGSYTVTIVDASSCTFSSTVLVANVGAPTITTGPVTNILCKGGNNGSATISITGGTPGYVINWTPASAGTGTTISSLIAGSYTAVVTDANNCVQNTVVTITEPLQLTAIASSISPDCPGAGSVSVTAGGGTTAYIYSWLPGGASSQTVTGLTGGTFTVTVTDANGCSQTSTASIVVPTALVLTVAAVDGTCGDSNGSASVSGSGGTPGYSYTWAPAGAGQTSVGLAANTYTITISDSKGCTAATTAIVGNTPPIAVAASATNVSCSGGADGTAIATIGGGTAPIIYSWSPAGGATSSASALKAGVYTVSVVDSKGCTATSVTSVTEPTAVTLSVPPAGKICIGQSNTLTATAGGGTPAYTYAWAPGPQAGTSVVVSPAVTTIYTVVVSDSKGCTTTSTVLVDVGPPLLVNAGAGKNVCAGTSTTITATAGGGDGNYTYTWQPGNVNGPSFSVTPNGSTIYTVTVSDGCGTPSATSVVTVQSVNPILAPAFTPDSTFGCAPLCVKFANTSTGGSSQSCSWEFGDGGSSQSCNPTYCYRKDGAYSVKLTVTDSNGCSSSLTKQSIIKVYSLPTAAFTPDPRSTSVLTPTINFKDNSTSDVVKWEWSFGDVPGSSSVKKNPSYTYSDTGRYEVQLIVTTAYGCMDTVEDFILIHGDYMIYIPNAFSPNADGKNETFFPKGFMIDPSCYKMLIFDRWGNMIFETTDLSTGWDGKANKGTEVAQQDVYVWKIIACDYMKKRHQYVGHVTLVR